MKKFAMNSIGYYGYALIVSNILDIWLIRAISMTTTLLYSYFRFYLQNFWKEDFGNVVISLGLIFILYAYELNSKLFYYTVLKKQEELEGYKLLLDKIIPS